MPARQCYALSGSGPQRHGWSVEEGLDDVVALARYFRENVANPTITILWVLPGSVLHWKPRSAMAASSTATWPGLSGAGRRGRWTLPRPPTGL